MLKHTNFYLLILILANTLCTWEVWAEPCVGKFVNPITDICWSCIFPIKIGNTSIYSGGREDTDNPGTPVCVCPREVGGAKVPLPGVPISFWEPARLADVTRTPYCMVSLGGVQLMHSTKKHGTVARSTNNAALKHSFYHVHWYIYPVMYWLEILTDFLCLEEASIDVGYMSEFDPLWNNDELNAILNPEAVLFGNLAAQLSCAADCMAANSGFSRDELFWCAGCNGSLYPFGGFIEGHVGGVQASSLIVERTIARLHRVGLAWDTVSDVCKKRIAPKVKKRQYKLQMTFPIANAKGPMTCNPFGRTTAIWGSGREVPGSGEDFGYLIWRKKYCCLH
ncbi:conjugal transfer protein [Rickettsiales endosymbiont of Peranema trichophorum]|uniref:conjugal transfer pilus assembly protein TraU n=1 Tax=Rickettsiales endosymbiont of Peranema trichophorum TaxID=2486577 RepID=UPI001022E380|nr:conjugal transfer pilus assembly protein TraU [Rickettsiales endosymbiont of Peranema trichophorum]RZI47496.1 conjugal transfer protein [Rickettsiales endosymbiont of Peranema trichophorum]